MKPHYNPFVDSHRDDDMEIARLESSLLLDDAKDAEYLAHCQARTRAILSDPRCQAAVDEIAEVLFDQLTIDRAALDEILVRHDIIEAPQSGA